MSFVAGWTDMYMKGTQYRQSKGNNKSSQRNQRTPIISEPSLVSSAALSHHQVCYLQAVHGINVASGHIPLLLSALDRPVGTRPLPERPRNSRDTWRPCLRIVIPASRSSVPSSQVTSLGELA